MHRLLLLVALFGAVVFASEQKPFTVEEAYEKIPFVKLFQEDKHYTNEQMISILRRCVAEENWQKGSIALYRKRPTRDGKVLLSGEFEEALEYYARSAKAGNPLSAYIGMVTLSQFYLMRGPITKKYIDIFAEAMIGDNMCFGVIMKHDAYAGGFISGQEDYARAYATLIDYSYLCKPEVSGKNSYRGYRHRLAKTSYLVSKKGLQ